MKNIFSLSFAGMFLLFMTGAAFSAATEGEKQIGTSGCKNGASSADFDTIAQCSSVSAAAGTFQKAPLYIGKVTAPPYENTKCTPEKEGLLQYVSGQGLQLCEGTSWQTLGGDGGSMPTGTVAFFALEVCPSGWVLADGANGTKDLRGEFIRALDKGRGVDSGRFLQSAQGDAIRNITGAAGLVHGSLSASSGVFSYKRTWPTGGVGGGGSSWDVFDFDASRVVPTANENRPRNIALLACQKL